jgi:hypothetical protein
MCKLAPGGRVTAEAKKSANLQIGQVVISVRGEDACPSFCFQPAHQRFLVETAIPDLALRVHYQEPPAQPLGEKLFDSGSHWSLYRHGENYLVALGIDVSHPRPYRLAVLDQAWRSGDLFISPGQYPSESGAPEEVATVNPFEYPLDELLIVNILARRRLGVIVHACGIREQGQGLLFCGVSGAGKSTIARLWEKTEVTLLSDDRIIIRRAAGRLWMHGTPWHGDARISSAEKAPLSRLYFLRHAPRNYTQPLSAPQATAALMVRCFPPFHDRNGMDFSLELLAQIASEIPCFELGFVPDASVVDFVRGEQ